MPPRTRIFSTVARLALAVGATSAAARPCRAAAADAWPSWPQAVRTAEVTGRPIVVVVTSQSNAASQEFRRKLATRVATRPLACPAHFTELSMEANPELAKKLAINTVPTILVYRTEKSGLVLVGRRSSPLDDATALDWLAESTEPARPAHRDPSVVRTLGHDTGVGVQPSSQQAYPPQVGMPPTSPPPVVAQPPPVVQQQQSVTTTLQTTPTVSVPITGPQAAPVVLQPPSSPIVVQPSPVHVMVGPAPAPVVTFVQGPSPAPQVSLASPSPPQAQLNLFVSGPQQVQTPQTSLSSPQQQTQVSTPQVAQSPTVAQTQTVQQQTVQLVPSVQMGQPLVQSGGPGVQTALVLQQPNLFNRMLAGLGRHLVQRGNPRVVMNTATPMTVQLPTNVAVQTPSVATPQQVTSTPNVQSPPPVHASPQSGNRHHFGLFHHDD
jgi:hypothetical protein